MPDPDTQPILILDEDAVRRAVLRITHEILERNPDPGALVLLGVPARGDELARRIAANLHTIEGLTLASGVIDVSMHRDDLPLRRLPPVVRATLVPVPVNGRNVVIVDDVFHTGRTARAAIEAVIALGRPASIQLAVLVDRGHRELPIRPDYVGKNLPTSRSERVMVRLRDTDAQPDSVRLAKPA
jgi:pyrimidine operon attenuation protein/uracil phosphoribosyltransferase